MNTYQRPILTLVSLIALLWQYGFSQSTEQCFDLEELYPDSTLIVGKATNTEAGEVIFSQETFSLSLDSFLYINETKGYENVFLSKEFFGAEFDNQVFLFPSNINIHFKWTSQKEKLNQLCFDFYDGGGQVNISINGSPLLPLDNLLQLNQFDENPFGDEVVVSVEEFPNSNFASGKLCIKGDISSLVIGGQEMGINNICYEVEKENNDCIGFDEVEQGVFGSSTQFSPGDKAFSVGEIDFYLLGMPTLFWTSLFGDLAVVESDFPSASFGEGPFLFFERISTGIDFSNYPVPVEKVSIDVRLLEGPVNVSANGGQSLLLFDLSPGKYSIGPDATLTIKVNEEDPTVNTLIFEGNIKSLLLGGMSLYADNLCINPEEPCAISELHVSPTRCNNDGEFYVNLDFEYEGTADSFYVYQNDQNLGLFNYNWLPVKLGPFDSEAGLNGMTFAVLDAKDPNCGNKAILEPFSCSDFCPIEEIIIVKKECPTLRSFMLTFDLKRDLNYEGTFTLYFENGEAEKFSYSDLPVRVEVPLEASQSYYVKIKVCDNSRDDCCVEKSFLATCIQECEISNLKVEPTRCDEKGEFYAYLNFEHKGNGEYFVLSQNGNEGRKVAYEALPLKLGPFSVYTDEDLYWEVYDLENPNCGSKVRLGAVECEPVCQIKEAKIYDVECIEEGKYVRLSLDLDHNRTEGTFIVRGENYKEDFSYADLPIRIKVPVSQNPEGYGKLIICDQNNEDCCVEAAYRIPCQTEECRFGELITQADPCNDDGTFFVELSFRYQNVSDSFYLSIPDTILKFAYADLPVKIGPFKGNTEERIRIKVKDAQKECGIEGAIIPANCGPNCSFQGIQAWTTDCDDNKQYYVKAQFRAFPSSVSPGYIAFVNGKAFGPFTYDNNELKLGPFDANTGTDNDLLLIDLLDPINCNASVELAPVYCETECGIHEVAANPIGCTDKETLLYKLGLGFDGSDDQLIEVRTQNESLGIVKAGDFPMEFEISIPENGQHPIFYFCIVDQPDCCVRVEADLPDCLNEKECDLSDLHAEAVDCSTNGTFYIQVEPKFESDGNGIDTEAKYHVYLGSQQVGTFQQKEFPVKVGPFERRPGNGVYVVRIERVVDQTDPKYCRETTQVRLSDCNNEVCEIGRLQLTPLSCNPDGTYTLSLNFEYQNSDSDSFSLYNQTGLLGVFALADLPLDFKAIPSTDGDIFKFEVCLGKSDQCCKGVELKVPDCPPPPCPIVDIRVNVDSCNAEGGLFMRIQPILDAEALNADDLFAVYVYDRFFGVFPPEEFPISVGPVQPDAGDLSVTVEQRGNGEGCYKRKLFEPPYCEDKCTITEFTAKVLNCNPDGTYTFEINLVADHPNNKYFDLYTPQGLVGYYELDDLPIVIDVLIPSGNSTFVFEACINDNPNCCIRFEGKLPECEPACPITELVAEVSDCLGEEEDEYSFKLDFVLDNSAEEYDSFYVHGQDSVFGPFALKDLPVTISPIKLEDDGNDSSKSNFILKIKGLDESCAYAFRVDAPDCPEIKVWPGDANRDRIANHRDLIYLGVAFGSQGPGREDFSSTWEGIPSTPWAQRFEDDINFKHADCNGDGVVDIKDKAVIARNYGQLHGSVLDREPLPQTDFAPPIFVDLPEEGELVPGSSFTIPIVLGTVDNPVKDIYGFAFNIQFDPKFIDPEKVQVHYPISWFGQEDVNVLTIDKIYREDGRIEIAMTRNDQNDVSGYGQVAFLKGIIADIAGIVDTRMETAQPMGISITAGRIPLGTQTTEIKLETYDDPYTILESFHMFPIPAGDVINFSNALGLPADEVRIFDLQGRQVLQTYKEVNEINIADLAAGMYLIRLKIQGIVINEKLLKR